MNDAHFHLLVNHLPIILPIIGFLILLGGWIVRSEIVKRTAFLIFILSAICTIPAFSSGEGAEEVAEHLQGVEERFIEIHEEAAETFAMLSYILGAISIVGCWASYKRKSFSNILAIIIMIFAAVVLVFARQAGTTGGEIRHPEIRGGFQPQEAPIHKV